MTITLPTLPGLTPNVVRSIPEKWSKAWYHRHIRDFLQWADIRNAIAGPGVIISGDITGPATISLAAGGTLFTGSITTAKLTGGGSNGSMVFSNGVLVSQTPAT